MPEVIVRYKNVKFLELLTDLAKYFDIVIEKPIKKATAKPKNEIPIDFAKDPDITALAGIWKDKDITLEDLRKNAWGDRL